MQLFMGKGVGEFYGLPGTRLAKHIETSPLEGSLLRAEEDEQ